jgi:hypothetical protein
VLIQGVERLFDLLIARYGDRPDARRQVAILFSFLDTYVTHTTTKTHTYTTKSTYIHHNKKQHLVTGLFSFLDTYVDHTTTFRAMLDMSVCSPHNRKTPRDWPMLDMRICCRRRDARWSERYRCMA